MTNRIIDTLTNFFSPIYRVLIIPHRWLLKKIHPIYKYHTLIQLAILAALFFITFKLLQYWLVPDEDVLFHQMTTYDYEKNKKGLKGIYIVGVVFFSGFLVMILTNGVRNSIERSNNGESRYYFQNHILIYGYNETVIGIITNIYKRTIIPPTIVIVVKENVKDIREHLNGIFGEKNKIHIMHSNMRGTAFLLDFYPNTAHEIFIVGSNEENVDFLNLQCYHTLSNIKGFNEWPAYIYLYLQEPSSFTMIKNREYKEFEECNKRLKIINTDEIWSRKIIVDSANNWPERNINMRNNVRITVDSSYFTHVIIYGLNTTSEILATTIAKTCHHPNYVTLGIRTKITIIDKQCTDKIGILFGKYYDYMDMCHYRIRKITLGQEEIIKEHKPIEGYDFLDTEWDFVESDPNDSKIHDEMDEYCNNKQSIVTIIICNHDCTQGINIALNLSKTVFDKKIPVWVYTRYGYNINDYMHGTRYDNVMTWGMIDEITPKEEWEEYSAKYLKLYSNNINNMLFSDIQDIFNQDEVWNEWNNITIAEKYVLIDTMASVPSIVGSVKSWSRFNSRIDMEDIENKVFSSVEHIRWCTCRLIDGYRVVTGDKRKQYENDIRCGNYMLRKNLLKEFYDPNIKPPHLLGKPHMDYDTLMVNFYLRIVNMPIKTS